MERPILFSAPMIVALLSGSKTQTRRIIKLPPAPAALGTWEATTFGGENVGRTAAGETVPEQAAIWHTRTGVVMSCPHGQAGDRLWVRETHRPIFGQTPGYLIAVDYRADPREKWARMGDSPDCLVKGTKWIPSIHMRREYSRILLEIVSIRVERLHAISEADCWAEGIEACDGLLEDMAIIDCAKRMGRQWEDAAPTYAALWESINGAGTWDANPWVWVIEFQRVTP